MPPVARSGAADIMAKVEHLAGRGSDFPKGDCNNTDMNNTDTPPLPIHLSYQPLFPALEEVRILSDGLIDGNRASIGYVRCPYLTALERFKMSPA